MLNRQTMLKSCEKIKTLKKSIYFGRICVISLVCTSLASMFVFIWIRTKAFENDEVSAVDWAKRSGEILAYTFFCFALLGLFTTIILMLRMKALSRLQYGQVKGCWNKAFGPEQRTLLIIFLTFELSYAARGIFDLEISNFLSNVTTHASSAIVVMCALILIDGVPYLVILLFHLRNFNKGTTDGLPKAERPTIANLRSPMTSIAQTESIVSIRSQSRSYSQRQLDRPNRLSLSIEDKEESSRGDDDNTSGTQVVLLEAISSTEQNNSSKATVTSS